MIITVGLYYVGASIQESVPGVFAEIEVLLTLDQLCKVYGKPLSTLYCDPESVVRFDRLEINTSNILGTTPPPSVILVLDNIHATLERISIQVRPN